MTLLSKYEFRVSTVKGFGDGPSFTYEEEILIETLDEEVLNCLKAVQLRIVELYGLEVEIR